MQIENKKIYEIKILINNRILNWLQNGEINNRMMELQDWKII